MLAATVRRVPTWAALRERLLPYAPVFAGLLFAMTLAVLPSGTLAGRPSSVAPSVRAHGFAQHGLPSLPLSAQGQLSAAVGADLGVYHVRRSAGGFEAVNPAQRLHARFGRSGVLVSSRAGEIGMGLHAIGYGSSMRPVGEAMPTAKANRVSFAHSGITEWYANGPLGLEQGFTIPKVLSADHARPLALSISLAGSAHATLAAGKRSLTLSRPRGISLYYGGLVASDATGRTLRSWLTLKTDRLLLSVDTRDATYPVRIDPIIGEAEKLTGAGEVGAGRFGQVAMSSDGDTALVGAGYDDGAIGAAWVFTRSGSTWAQEGQKLTGGGVGQKRFGSSVALSSDGNTALIGGSWDNGGVGAAWVFTRSGATWTQQGEKLTGGAEIGPFGQFGSTAALSSDGNTALIGGPGDSNFVGAAWVFTRSGSTWSQQGGKLTGADEAPEYDGQFGGAIALSSDGNTALIGGGGDHKGVGAAWAFTRSGSTWSQQGAKLTGGGESDGGGFGSSVALSSDGDTALIGAGSDKEQLGPKALYPRGAAWVFTRSASTWTQQGEKLTGSGDSGGSFGSSAALSADGNTALIGGFEDNLGAGAAWVFSRSGGTWTQQGQKLTDVVAPTNCCYGGFGTSVALPAEGAPALIGDPSEDAESGTAWVGSFSAFSQEAPEFGTCTPANYLTERVGGKLIKYYIGDFTASKCVLRTESNGHGRGKNEWNRGLRRVHFATNSKELREPRLQTVSGSTISCSDEIGTGDYSSTKAVANVILRLTGCHLGEAGSCQSADAVEGEIATTTLSGELGVLKASPEGPAKNTIGLDLQPASGEVFAAFRCAGISVLVTGSVISTVTRNSMKVSGHLSLGESKGKQKWTHFEGGEEDVLQTKFGEGTVEKSGLALTMIQTNEEKVEVNSVV